VTRSDIAPGVTRVREVDTGGCVPLRVHPQWAERWNWLAQGTTWRGASGDFDLGLSGTEPVGAVLGRWKALRSALGCDAVVHARQVHATEIRVHDAVPPGLLVIDGCDGHHSAMAGLALTVSVADCVPVSIVDPGARAATLLHAGWRGTAGGIIERGIELACRRTGASPDTLHLHLGPAICGHCYEVGPEVHERLGLPAPAGPAPVDLRAIGAARARTAGVPAAAITISATCTLCDADRPFFSHRAGEAQRQMGVLGIRGRPG
jgi:YfiH family protein